MTSKMFSDLLSMIDFSSLDKLLIATFLGALVGFERERSGKVAGMRTHALVALGAALFTLISVSTFEMFPSVNGVRGFDYHLIANIVVGIGFIGAGAILKRETRVEGTTTAASLWVVAAIGIASGFGLYKQAVSTTIIAYMVLTLLWLFEKYLNRDIRYKSRGIYGVLKNHNGEEHAVHEDGHVNEENREVHHEAHEKETPSSY